jgi:hypothetical protein
MVLSALPTPLPSSPARGEVPGNGGGKALPKTQSNTHPLAGLRADVKSLQWSDFGEKAAAAAREGVLPITNFII